MKKYFSTKKELEGSAEWSTEPDKEMIAMSTHEELQSSVQSSRESSTQHSSSNQTDCANLVEMDDNDDSMLEVLRLCEMYIV